MCSSRPEAAVGVTGTLRIGAYSMALFGPHLSEIIEVFEGRHPQCRVTYVDTGLDRDYLDWLRAGNVDNRRRLASRESARVRYLADRPAR